MILWLRYRWDRLLGRWRRCRIEDGYCLIHHTSRCSETEPR